jgi:hypothetical protein
MLRSRSAAFLVLAFAVLPPAMAVDQEEQSRRCRMEKSSLTNESGREGPECLKLRAMLGMPEPPVVNIYELRHRGGKRYYDARSKREVTDSEVYYADGQRCEVRGGSAHCEKP